jgi:hypothetical protein
MSYLGAAVSVSQGRGLRIPTAPWNSGDSTSQLKTFPPSYSLVLALPIRLGMPQLAAARAVQAAAAGVTVTIISSLALSLAGPWAALLVTGLLLLTPALVEDHLSVMSEPLYLMLLAAFVALTFRRPGYPFMIGCLAALGVAVRYLGGALVGAAVLWALWQDGTRRERLRRAALALLPTLILGLAWIVAIRGSAGRPPAAALIADFSLGPAFADLWSTLVDWLAPTPPDSGWLTPVALLTRLLVVLLLSGAARRVKWRAWRTQPLPALWLVATLLIGAHLAVLLFARIFVGHEIPFDDRLLSPVMLLLDLLLAVGLAGNWPGWLWSLRGLAALVVAVWAIGAVAQLRDLVNDAHTNGWDYNQLEWQHSPTVAWADSDSGRQYTLFSNHPVPLWFHAGRASADLPHSLDSDTLAAFAARLGARPSAVVVFADTTWEPDVPVDSLVAALGLRTVEKFDDGVVYEGAVRH